ncbi:DUF2130 domain-containing protein [Streptococcus ruminantium]|uniref:DUF2130 domain-containing protein n=1 Tax=Streptococcus ruminantium TaxID=1917441 RepID=A0ABU1B543_9STRE|nr:DUF2130 domain-containing protein [Streptococcus ruminantium]MDQ8758747.1 DUF2130 domain-containing protein [Streptococcus ruminantium]MDQ8765581.1 DUF2130 domain-containing protein [Streptococcus ruminantium]MDQ8768530.1 DUF2130 domain-containing protein [Streptococcus ruminantium]MDQ8775080.1 DUF2130 domain-containing protein [Streptococcus ruminantium]MDQ8794216.1 DUF2130 domain-containing protein [Streptococcus ruminantium]
MHNITCPHCGTAFQVNETEYSQLLAQVRGAEFDKEVHERLARETELLIQKAENDLQTRLGDKDKEIFELTAKLDKIASQTEFDISSAISQKDQEIQELKAQLDKIGIAKDLELQRAVAKVEKERDAAQAALAVQEQKQELVLANTRQEYEVRLKAADEQVEFYKNFKAQQSTKAIGESLELYAEAEFNKVRQLAFPNAYFEKDNQVSACGSKGDYIYRELDENGVEILSIMFEMKNEADDTIKKHKNEDFFKELDKDRREKECEYAVLVTMLEADNDYYNTGIVDVSHKYEKMYVVRPQFFIQLIGLLRNAALNSLKYKQELALVREQHIDITHFEEDLATFKTAFAKNYQSASNNFQKAIDEIDKAIKRMEAVKAALTTSENQLRLANNKLDDVSVKKLTRNNPTMKAKFEALKGG